jgi:hypothetical protein
MSEATERSKVMKDLLSQLDVHFALTFSDDGTIKQVFGPGGNEITGVPLKQNPIKNMVIDEIKEVTILSDPRHSPCCIVVDGIRYCWCE